MQEFQADVHDLEEILPTVMTVPRLPKLQEIYNENVTKAFGILRDLVSSLAAEEIEQNILEDRIENYRSFVSHYCLYKERTQIPDALDGAGDSLSTANSPEVNANDKVDASAMDIEPVELHSPESVPEGTTFSAASCLGQDPKKSPGIISRIRHALSRRRANRQRPTRDIYTETSSLPGSPAWPLTQNGDGANGPC